MNEKPIPDFMISSSVPQFFAKTRQERIGDWMPCGHELRHWKPLEGTAGGFLEFQRDPEKHGFCEVCYAVEQERKRCLRLANQLHGIESIHDLREAIEYSLENIEDVK